MKPDSEYPFTVPLSFEEVVALVKFHNAQSKRITRAFGKASLEERAKFQFFPSAANLKRLHDEAKSMIEKRCGRAKSLLAILPKK